MKHRIKLLAGLIVPVVLLAGGCDKDPEPDKNIDVKFISLEADGSTEAATTQLTLTFDQDITDLKAADITLKRGSTGTVKGDLTRIDTGVYVLAVKDIKASGDIAVSIKKSGYTITEGQKTVTVYCSPLLNSKAAIEAFIDEHWQEYGYSARPTKYIALSFDDGPCAPSNSGGTAAMLEKLDELQVKATFFVIGQNVRSNKAAAQAIFNKGHELGNHSDSYDSLGSATVEKITASLDAASSAINDITGKDPVLFRAPNLNHGPNLTQVCAEKGMALIDGSTNDDWPGNSAAIKTSVLSNPQDGGIILLHENNTSQGNTMAVLPDIISGLREKGFWIMTVSELAVVKEVSLQPGTRYNSIR